MSYAEKPEDITREEWMDKLNNVHIQRADMNRLIMNYLVTGVVQIFLTPTLKIPSFLQQRLNGFLFNRGLQGSCRKIQDGIWNRAQRGLGLPG